MSTKTLYFTHRGYRKHHSDYVLPSTSLEIEMESSKQMGSTCETEIPPRAGVSENCDWHPVGVPCTISSLRNLRSEVFSGDRSWARCHAPPAVCFFLVGRGAQTRDPKVSNPKNPNACCLVYLPMRAPEKCVLIWGFTSHAAMKRPQTNRSPAKCGCPFKGSHKLREGFFLRKPHRGCSSF